MKTITTTLVSIGKFHLFALARELLKKGMLERIFSGYPSWKLWDEDIPAERIETFPWLQTIYMALAKYGIHSDSRLQRELAWIAHETLDHRVTKRLPNSDVLFVLSGAGLTCGQEAQKRGVKYICDRGSSHIRYQNALLQEEFRRWGEKFVGVDHRAIAKEESEYEVADVITVPSSFVNRSFLEMGVPGSKICMVPYGVDIRLFEKVADPEPNAFNVLFVGQVCFRKGVPDLLEAFRMLQHSNKKLWIAGGIRPEMVRYLHRHGVPDQVEFLGHIPQAKLKQIMSRSHVMVLASIEEGLALVQAQALACGCPVISTHHTGAEDLFNDGKEGFIVPIRDPFAIADRLTLLADDPQRRSSMSEAALQRVDALGGWTRYGNQMVETLQNTVCI